MKKQWKAVVGVLTAAVVLAGQVNVGSAVAAKKVDFSKENNMWETVAALQIPTGLSGVSPYRFVAKSAPKKRVARINFSYSTQNAPNEYSAFKYDKKGNLKKLVGKSKNGNGGYYTSTAYTFRYDKDGLLAGETYSVAGKYNSTTTVETDGKGRIVSDHTDNEDGFNSDSVYKYKGSNLVRERHTTNSPTFPPTDHILKYNASGKLTSLSYKDVNSGKITIRTAYQYDEKGRMVSATEDRMNGEGLEAYQLTYDADGYLTQIVKRHPGADYTMNTDFIYETVK